ncbi:hypothetical protein CMU85_10130 [Elizabethkingia anophelis]|uniref:hypothetical protein n=1 Tax=Elizabethkingia anophelis TaxID=1117645 RepID=UPI0021A2FBEC|nr:hypothetical protein [Elizabethkingia anophelis]MCT4227555.1 hypothetical protein [Elizabethkingia anophelis]MCT4309732.1 hypothetical protein [Elizabethkingia anophelis]MDV3581868.1 hypothetical protein [Elizabethkingia anophelis]MDV3869337.1 hypothetical protein [Elizabethkingia anophelis]
MKTQIIFFTLLAIISCKSQEIVSTNSKDIKIRSLTKEVSLLVMDSVEIMNNTNVGYLINKKGFHGYSDIYENGEKMTPLGYTTSYPAKWTTSECKESILIIPKYSTVKTLLYLESVKEVYRFNNQNKYSISYKSEHTARSPYYYGCKQYVDSLVTKGYKIFEGTIKDTKPLITEYRK